MLALRGNNATAEREAARRWWLVPGYWRWLETGSLQGVVVSEYKHLRIWVSLRPKCVRDARHKEDQAMASYSPLAVKVFGNRRIRTWLNMALMRSLVLSRLCFNLHISVPRPWLLKRLNRVHMRVLRRIARCIKWDRHGRCWSTSSFKQSCETDAGRTEHRLYCGQSETQILASCDDVGTFNAQVPYMEKGETDGVGIASARRLGCIGLQSFGACHSGRAEPHGSQFDRCAVGYSCAGAFLKHLVCWSGETCWHDHIELHHLHGMHRHDW